MLGSSTATASPYSYTRNHCISFARQFTDENFRGATVQVRYLTRSVTLNSVERWADAWWANPNSQRLFNGLVNSCYNVVF